MNLLTGTRVYLCGAVEHDQNAKPWRVQITERLKPYSVQVYDPLVKPDWLPEICKVDPSLYRSVLNSKSDALTKQEVYDANTILRQVCLTQVSSADWLICWMPIKYTAGSFEELYLARQLNKPVFFCVPDGIPSTWLLPQFSTPITQDNVWFENWDKMFEYLNKLHNGQVSVDPVKWMPITYPSAVKR